MFCLRSAQVALALGVCLLLPSVAQGAAPLPHTANEVIIKFKPGATPSQKSAILSDLKATNVRDLNRINAKVEHIAGISVEQAVTKYSDNTAVEFIEPNYILTADEIPNDPRFGELWGLRNLGQTGGTPGADISAVSAWDVFSGTSDVLIGVIDTGVDYLHPDLAANIYVNVNEIAGNGIDDDHNGFIDDVHGWDFINHDNDPMDDNGHGTHVSGTIGAVGNNSLGVVGVNWHVRIMPLKFLGSGGSGSTADAVSCVEYATMMGVRLTSNSWGGGGFSEAMRQAIADAGAAGILFVAAAGNDGTDNDLIPHYPASYSEPNVISVAATDDHDRLASFSCFGRTSVDLAAPGVSILSTMRSNAYAVLSGTSMATPHVSGALALIIGRFPAMSGADAKGLLLAGVDALPGLAGRMVTGGRLNAFRPIAEEDSIPPAAIPNLSVIGQDGQWIRLAWTASGDDGMSGTASRYEVRYASFPISALNFNTATLAPNLPDPGPSGTPEQMKVEGLNFSTSYYFAVEAFDEFGNASPISNVPTGTTIGPPDIAYSPASFSDDLLSGGSSNHALTLQNLGAGELVFDLSAVSAGGTAAVRLFSTASSSRVAYTQSIPPLVQTAYDAGASPFREPLGSPSAVRTGSSSGFNILLLESGGDVTEIRSALESFPDISGVDVFDGTGTAPTLDNLLPYDAVIVIVNRAFGDPVTVGNVLADFADTGGGVIMTLASFISGYQVQGRFLTGGYFPFNLGTGPGGSSSLGTYDTSHPIMRDVTGATGGLLGILTLAPGAELVASWVNTQPFVATQGSNVVGVNIFLGGAGYWTGDIPLLLHNAAQFSAHAVQWLSGSPKSGVIPGGGSLGVVITVNAAGLFGGIYDAALEIQSNDPDEATLQIPAHLSVTGVPEIALGGEPVTLESVVTYSGSGTSTTHHLAVTVTPAGGGTLELLAEGDYGDAVESATATVEGTVVGSVGSVGTDCAPASGSFAVSADRLATWTADNAVSITVQNSAEVNDFCSLNRHTVRLKYAGPANALNFGDVFIGGNRTLNLTLSNLGTDVLNVSSIGVDNPAFQVSASSLLVDPGQTVLLGVTFRPVAATQSLGTLTVISNDSDEGSLHVSLTGMGVVAPDISVSPTSLSQNLFSGGSSNQTLSMLNTGGSVLDFTVEVRPVLANTVSSPFAGLSPENPSASNNPAPQQSSTLPTIVEFIGAVGDFENLAPSPAPMTCIVGDPASGRIYGQANAGTGFYVYRASTNAWVSLAPAPLPSGNNGGAALLNGKIYTCYTENSSQLGVYDIGTNTWSTISNPLGAGTGDIASDGSHYLYLVIGTTFMRLDPVTMSVTPLAAPTINFEPWGALRHLSGVLYGHQGNGNRGFASYDIASNTWTTLPVLPSGAVLGADINPLTREYFAYGSYGGTNLYRYSIDDGVWSASTIPFFSVYDGGLACLPAPGGVYFVQGETGTGLARMVTAIPFLTVTPEAGSLSPSGTVSLNAHFSAQNLNAGPYDAIIAIQSNDPDESTVEIPAHLSVTGAPDIVLSGEQVIIESSADYVGSGASTSHTLLVTTPPQGGGTFELLANGDYGDGSESATLVAEGTTIGAAGSTGADCSPASGSFPINVALLSSLVADGRVSVLVQNSLDVNDFCEVNRHTVRLRYSGPADHLNFGGVFVGVTQTLKIHVSNAGTDVLNITSISANAPEFTVSVSSLTLSPGQSQDVPVSFHPTSAGVKSGTLTVTSNDADEASLQVSLSGEGLIPPDISVSPTSLSEALFSGSTSTKILTLSNTGGSALNFTLELTFQSSTAVSVAFAGLSQNNNALSDNPAPQHPGIPPGPVDFIGAVGDFESLAPSPVPLTCVVADPGAGLLYGQANQGTAFYRYRASTNTWETLTASPITSGNNGGAALLNGKIYTSYTLNDSQLGVYDIASNTWTIRANPLGLGTGNIASDGVQYLYLVVETSLVRLDPVTSSTTSLASPPFGFTPWGGLRHLNGVLYGHQGDGFAGFGSYTIATNVWAPLTSVPGGAVLGADIDPRTREYITYGTYGGKNLYRYSIDSGVWSVSSIPFFFVNDGGVGSLPSPSGVYFVEGESGAGLARLLTAPPFLTMDPTAGSVPAGGTLALQANFNAAGLIGGTYDALVAVRSNDPDESTVEVPAELRVTGAPDITLSVGSLDFGSVFVGGTATRNLTVSNPGTDVLIVSSVTVNSPDYAVTPTSFNLSPGQGQQLIITFHPSTTGARTANLAVTSNDPDEGTANVSLSGVGLIPPDIAVSPTSLSANLLAGESSTQTLELSNTGGSPLDFTVEVRAAVPGAVLVEFAGLAPGDAQVSNNPPPGAPGEASDFIGAVGDFEPLAPSPAPMTCVVADPGAGFVYGQANQGTAFYRYRASTNAWETLTASPINSGNNGGAAILNGKVYTTYTGNPSFLGVYDIATNTWSTRAHPLSNGTGNIASDGSRYLYLIAGTNMVRLDPASSSTTFMAPCPLFFQAWGGLRHLNGVLYGHTGNNTVGFCRYTIATNSWTVLPALPSGGVLGADINPLTHEYFAYGNYGGNNLYRYSIDDGTWSVLTIPFFFVGDGGLAWLPSPEGVYFVQGEEGIGLGRLLTGVPFLNVEPLSGTVPPAGRFTLNAAFNTLNQIAGNYDAIIEVNSNDPDESIVNVPAHLTVIGAPSIQFGQPSLNFGEVLVGLNHDLDLLVRNVGTDVLSVTSIVPGLADYSALSGSFTIAPRDFRVLKIRFAPLSGGVRNTTLTFNSNDPHSPHTFPVSGIGIIPPVAEVTPASIVAAAPPGGTKTKTLRVCNTGGSDLEFTVASPTPPPPPQGGPKIAVHVRSHTSKGVQTCMAAEDGGAAPTNIPCSQFVTNAPTMGGRDIYLVAAGIEEEGVTGLTCGVTYDGVLGRGVDVSNWTFCGDGLQFPSDTWPAAGSGNRVTWLTCQDRSVPPDGIHAIAGAFYVYAYGPDTFQIIENRTVTIPELKYANCQGEEIDIPVTLAGSIRFSSGGTQPGFNPCLGGSTVFSAANYAKGAEDRRIGTPVLDGRGGPDHYGYRWVDSDETDGPTFNWLEISGLGTQIPLAGDDATSEFLPIGLSFPFYGEHFTEFAVCTNGWISFTSRSTEFLNQPLPSLGAPNNLIAPFWDDLYFASLKAYYMTDGTKLVVEFQNVFRRNGQGPYTFEVILHADGTIVYQYLSMVGPVTSATVGIQNGTWDDGLMMAFNTSYLKGNLAVRITTAPLWLNVFPLAGTLSPSQCMDLSVFLDATHLVPDDYTSSITILSNDPFNPSISRDVLFHVGTITPTLTDVDPDALNAGSPGNWVTAYIELPTGLNPADILVNSVKAGPVPADSSFNVVGDHNLNGIPDRTLKFNRSNFIKSLPDADSVQVVITGEVRDQTYFVGQDGIRLLRPHLRTLNSGGSFITGSVVEVRWDVPKSWTPQYADLFYSLNDGATWTSLASGVTGKSYVWRLPQSLTETARVSVYVYGPDGLMGLDRSDQSFKIVNSVTGVAEDSPPVYGLLQNVPNPFTGSTTIHFSLEKNEGVLISVFDLNGRRVRELVNGLLPMGHHQVTWDGRSAAGETVASGLYLYRMETAGYTEGKRMYLLH